MLRLLVVGDLLTVDGALDREYASGMLRLARKRRDVTQFGYSHAWRISTVTKQ